MRKTETYIIKVSVEGDGKRSVFGKLIHALSGGTVTFRDMDSLFAALAENIQKESSKRGQE
jgi:hypothetical protein